MCRARSRFSRQFPIALQDQSKRIDQVLARVFDRFTLRDGSGNLFDESSVATLFGRNEDGSQIHDTRSNASRHAAQAPIDWSAHGVSDESAFEEFVEVDGQLQLPVMGRSGQRVRLQRSENLVDWEDWQTMTLGGTGCGLIDRIGVTPQRFYRILEETPEVQ